MANEQPTPFASVLKHYRTAAGLTQEQLAVRAKLSPETVAALERGKRRAPRASTVELLADALALGETERAALLAAAQPPSTPAPTSDSGAASLTSPSLWRMAEQPTPLVGREGELETIRRYVVSDGTRFLTLVGPAGVGKTRLVLAAAAQLADRFPDGVTPVDLAPLSDPQLVLPTCAQAFGLTDVGNIPILDRVRDYVRERRLLAVLDNFDRVLPAAAALAELVATCPRLVLLVTSRAPLQVRWEQVLRVAPLTVPDPDAALPPLEALAQIPAVEMFVARARARRADFALTAARAPLVARLVAQLDGLPLALELAAARLDTLPLATIVEGMGDRLRLLRWDAADLPARQRSLEAAIGWSYELLPDEERRLLRHLGVFLGQVALDAIHALQVDAGEAERESDAGHTLEGLASLAEKSLILPAREEDLVDEEADAAGDVQAQVAMGGPTFGVLETVREYAWEQLEGQRELPHDRARHAGYFLALAERADPQLRRPGQRAWFLRLERERDNLRAALRWLLDQDGPDEPAGRTAALRLAAALGYFWRRRGHLAEGARWLEEALASAPAAGTGPFAPVRTHALIEWGELLTQQGELDRAHGVLQEALALAQEEQDATAIARALTALGMQAAFAGQVVESTRLLQDALHRWQELGGDTHEVGMTLFFLGIVASTRGNDEEAVTFTTQALDQIAASGDERLAADANLRLAMLEHTLGDPARAIAQARGALDVSVTFYDRWLLSVCARVALALGSGRADLQRRAQLLGAADALGQASSDPLGVWEQLVEDPGTAKLRALIARGEHQTDYQAGRSLSFEETANFTRSLLADVTQTPTGAET